MKPIPEKTMDEWLRRAEALAGVPHLKGGLWHPYRRSWATSYEGESDVIVAAMGGWEDINVMKASYQKVTATAIVRVAQNRRRVIVDEQRLGEA